MLGQRLARSLVLLLSAQFAVAAGAVERITVLHLNDLHARLEPDHRGRGGFAYVASVIERERRASEAAIVLHAGDLVQGSPVSTIFRGTPAFEVANALGIDVHCLGNHEFDYGWKQIRAFESASNAPIVSANVVNASGDLLVPAFQVVRVGSLDVAVIGALTPRLPSLIGQGLAGPWRAAPLVQSLRSIVAEVHERVDLVIVLGHLYDEEDETVLREIPEVDLLVGGHNHGGRESALVVDGRIGVKLRPYGVEVGRLDLWFDPVSGRISRHRWNRIPVHREKVPAHRQVAALVEKWEARVSDLVDVTIGRCARDLGRSEVQALVERAIRETTGADLAYMNRGGRSRLAFARTAHRQGHLEHTAVRQRAGSRRDSRREPSP